MPLLKSIFRIKRILLILIVIITIILFITFPRAYRLAENYTDYKDNKFPVTNGFYHYSLQDISQINLRKFDKHGIVVHDYGDPIGIQYNPVTISQFVLELIPYRERERIKKIIFRQLDLLISYSHKTQEGNIIYPYLFDWPSRNETAPWYSSMAQGQAASALLWGYKISNNNIYLNAAKKSIMAMMEVSSLFFIELHSGIWLKEYPHYKFNVLDGSLAAIAGVYDLYRSLSDSDPIKDKVEIFLNKAIKGFIDNHNCFHCFWGGHYYSDNLTIISSSYYGVNMGLLNYLSKYDRAFYRVKELYNENNTSFFKAILKVYWNAFYQKIIYPLNLQNSCVT